MNLQYNVEPGAKGITELLQKIPTWLTLSNNEKCEVCSSMTLPGTPPVMVDDVSSFVWQCLMIGCGAVAE